MQKRGLDDAYTGRSPENCRISFGVGTDRNRAYIMSWSHPTRLPSALKLIFLEYLESLRGKRVSRKAFHRPITGPGGKS